MGKFEEIEQIGNRAVKQALIQNAQRRVAELNIDDTVQTPFEHIKGKIIGVYISHKPTQYFVRYFMDSEIKEEYFYTDELIKKV